MMINVLKYEKVYENFVIFLIFYVAGDQMEKLNPVER